VWADNEQCYLIFPRISHCRSARERQASVTQSEEDEAGGADHQAYGERREAEQLHSREERVEGATVTYGLACRTRTESAKISRCGVSCRCAEFMGVGMWDREREAVEAIGVRELERGEDEGVDSTEMGSGGGGERWGGLRSVLIYGEVRVI
jgi:hypothetical protein